MKLFGYTFDKNGVPAAETAVEIKDEQFQTIYATVSDELGYYEMEVAAARYPFVIAVKEYGIHYLEYWCQNIDLRQEQRLDIRMDMLEVYGLHAFRVKGGRNALMVYFRPMSLAKYLLGEADIAPEIKEIRATLDGKAVKVLVTNQVKESIGESCLTAYLIQINHPGGTQWNRLDVEIWDQEDHYGAATIFGI